MSPPEFEFYKLLHQLYGGEYLIFVKPRFEDFIHVGKGIVGGDRRHYRNHIKSRHTDFLICSKKDSKPVAAVELDDSSHDTKRAVRRDSLMNNICASADMKYIHIPLKRSSDTAYIRKMIAL